MAATTASIPAPLGGWNARDSLAEMSPTDAVQMTNLDWRFSVEAVRNELGLQRLLILNDFTA